MDLKYYVLGKKDSPLLKKYLSKYYDLLLEKPLCLKNSGILSQEISSLLNNSAKKKFVINADNSSMINYLYLEKVDNIIQNLGNYSQKEKKFKIEIEIFLNEGINSFNLIMNKGKIIAKTNIRLTNIDNSPYNQLEAHPDHKNTGGVLGWGEKQEDEWLSIYEKTFTLLKKTDELVYDELNQIITKIIPLGTSRGLHNSASYKECVGHLYMGYTIDLDSPEINNLEAIIHESSHNKLNLIMQFDQIVLNDKQEIYYSAIRPDARHIQGVFLGYHAFAPTMYIIMKAYKQGILGNNIGWLEKIVLYYIKTKFLQKVIKKYAILTNLGKDISKEIDYVIVKMDTLLREINPDKSIILLAKQKQIDHFNQVNGDYPYLKY